MKFGIYDDDKVAQYLALIEGEERSTVPADAEEGDQAPAQPGAGEVPGPVPVSAAADGGEESMES